MAERSEVMSGAPAPASATTTGAGGAASEQGLSAPLSTVEDLGELPVAAPARPRVLLIGTVFAAVAAAMTFAGLLGTYLALRQDVVATGAAWLPSGVEIPLTPANMALLTLGMSVVTMQWAVYAIGNEDRRGTFIALGLSLLLGVAYLNGIAFYYSQMGLEVASVQGALIYAISGAHLVLFGGAMLFAALMTFRTLGGQYGPRDREGIVAATIVWDVAVAVYAVIWYAIFVSK